MPRTRSAALLIGLALVAALALVLARAQPARAHAVLERSLPAQDERLELAPELVETWYSEPLERQLTKVEVLDTQGNPVHVGDTIFSDEDTYYAAVALPVGLGPGIYTVSYENVSSVDGHQWTGSFSFIVLNPDGSVPQGTAFTPEGGGGEQGYLPEAGDTALRWLAIIAAVAMAGAAMFFLVVARPASGFLPEEQSGRVERAAMTVTSDIVLLGVPVLLFAATAQLALLADRLGGAGAIDDILFHTRTGALWLARAGCALLVLAAFLPALLSERWRAGAAATAACLIALVAGVSVLMMYSLNSHGATGGGEFWSVSSDFLHFAATAAWVGGLLQLPLVFWWTRERLDRSERLLYIANVFDRFSWLAVIAVTLILGTGVFNGFVQLPTWEALWDTTYGRVLIAKLLLILPLLGVAAINAVFLKPALVDATDALYGQPDEPPAARDLPRVETRLQRLQRALPYTVAAEFGAAAIVLLSVSILVQTTPAESELRQAQSQGGDDYVQTATAGDLSVDLRVSPFVVGLNTFTLVLTPEEGADLGRVLQVQLRARFDDRTVAPTTTSGQQFSQQELTPTGDPGTYSAESSLLTRPGDWLVEARIQRAGVDDTSANFVVPQVGGPQPEERGLFDLPFDFVNWNIVAGGALIALGLGATLIWYNRPSSWRRSTANSVVFAGGALMVTGAVLLFGVDVHETVVSSTSPIAPTESSVATGRQLYETNCRMCHGDGTGNGPLASTLPITPPRYVDHIPYHSDGTIFTWISEGMPLDAAEKIMPPFSSKLSEEERWHLVNYLRVTYGAGGAPVLPDDTPAAGQPTPTVPAQQASQ
jgi:copper transport protein